ncbi:MAG: cell wall hydrolase [Lachnospiraceae bacterium]|nr:cell wall hydrolase [Lachnospiraceae bacterium]
MELQNTNWRKQILKGFLFILLLLCFSVKANAAWTENADGSWSWYTSSGKLATSKWIQSQYYVDENGVRVTGLQKIDGKYYFFSKSTGKLICGTWIKSGSKYYYAKKNGVLCVSCIKKINGSSYYFNAKGVRKTGKITVDGNTYYFNKSTEKMVTSKWVCISKKYYYFGSDGIMVKSAWVGRYYVNSKGVRVTNTWVDDKYLGSDGKCVSGLQEIDGKYYYFNTSTYKKVTGMTIQVGQYTYVFDSDGVGTIASINDRPLASVSVENTYYTDLLVEDEDLLAAIIFCEAGNQSYTGQLAVGLVILNRVNSSTFAASTLREVIYSTSQFEPARTGTLNKALSGVITVSDSCRQAAAELMALNEEYQKGVTPTLTVDGEEIAFPYLFFLTPSAYRAQGLTASYITIGDHVFFKVWK